MVNAAQYVRMSTDKQDLSPAIQRQAVAAYATANGLEIIASYDDEGRSGVRIEKLMMKRGWEFKPPLATEPVIKTDDCLLKELRQAFARKPHPVTCDEAAPAN